ncbi:MAG: ribosome maturation factor RimP [Deltaproteobacteria bacterium]|nr:ribosome maturation factor RimP [Deltaproteobacteria bacterium]
MTDIVRLEKLIDTALETLGYALVEVEHTREGGGLVLRVYIDHPATGPAQRGTPPRRVTLEDCGRVSRHLGTVFDVEDLVDTAYRLEVSSPGVLRPLRKVRDFERFVGFAVKVRMKEPIAGQRSFVGQLVAVEGEKATIDVDGVQHSLSVAGVKKARLDEEY